MTLKNWQNTWDSMSWLSPGQFPPCWHEGSDQGPASSCKKLFLYEAEKKGSLPLSRYSLAQAGFQSPLVPWPGAHVCSQFHWLGPLRYHWESLFLTRQMVPECWARVNAGSWKPKSQPEKNLWSGRMYSCHQNWPEKVNTSPLQKKKNVTFF